MRGGRSRSAGRTTPATLALFAVAVLALACDAPVEKTTCSLHARPQTTAVAFDANSDGVLDVADGAYLMARNFRGGGDPPCLAAVEGFGDKVSDVASSYAMWYALISGTAVPVLTDDACRKPAETPADCGDELALSMDAIDDATGSVGALVHFSAGIHLRSPKLPVEAWSVSVKATGCTVVSATLSGGEGGDVRDNPPGARNGGIGMAQVSKEAGAVSLVVLDPIRGTTMQPEGAATILLLDLTATVGSSCSTCTLSFTDGQSGNGRPLTNAVSSNGRSYTPVTTGMEVSVCPTAG